MNNKQNKKSIISEKILAAYIYEDIDQAEQIKHLKKNDINLVVDSLIEKIKKSLSEKNEVKIKGLGTLKTTVTKPRTVINIRTKEKINIPAKRVVKFVINKEFKGFIETID